MYEAEAAIAFWNRGSGLHIAQGSHQFDHYLFICTALHGPKNTAHYAVVVLWI